MQLKIRLKKSYLFCFSLGILDTTDVRISLFIESKISMILVALLRGEKLAGRLKSTCGAEVVIFAGKGKAVSGGRIWLPPLGLQRKIILTCCCVIFRRHPHSVLDTSFLPPANMTTSAPQAKTVNESMMYLENTQQPFGQQTLHSMRFECLDNPTKRLRTFYYAIMKFPVALLATFFLPFSNFKHLNLCKRITM